VQVPLHGINYFTVSISTSARTASRAAQHQREASRLAGHASREDPTALPCADWLTALSALRIRVPYVGTTVSMRSAQTPRVAFQKAYGLSRTYVFDGDDWRKIDVAKVVKRGTPPQRADRGRQHRQILMM